MSKVELLAAEAAKHLQALMRESAAQIEAAMITTASEADAAQSEAKMTIGFAIVVSLDRNTVTHRLSFATRHRSESVAELPDINQENLPLTTAEEDAR